jgi:hypothetical protein
VVAFAPEKRARPQPDVPPGRENGSAKEEDHGVLVGGSLG